MQAVDYAKSNLSGTLDLLSLCVGELSDEQYNWQPPGNCNSASKSHVHALATLDFFVRELIQGRDRIWTPLAEQHGLPAMPRDIWAYEKAIPFAVVQQYAQDVRQDTLEFVASLTDADLDREVDAQVFGKKSVAWLLQFSGGHALGHGGDIAAVKGMQGLKGLPF